MAIVDIIPTWTGNDSDASADVKLTSDSRQRSDRLGWTVLVERADDYTANTLHTELHRSWGFVVGGEHPTDPYLRATHVRVSRVSPILFAITVTFHAQGDKPGENPLDEPVSVLPDFVGSTEAVDEDFLGNALATVNDEPFDPPLTADIYDLVLNIRRNLPAFDYQLAWQYMGDGKSEPAHNSDEFLGFPAGTARIIKILPEEVDTEDFTYFRVTMSVQFRRKAKNSTDAKAWYKRVLHKGFKVKDPFDPDHQILDRDDDGLLLVTPSFLSEDGFAVPAAQAHWLEFQMGPSLPFADLGMI